MRKRYLVPVLWMTMILAGCGQQTEVQNVEATKAEHAEEEHTWKPENLTGEAEEQESEQQESEEEDQYAIYERFMAGDEPLYIREDQYSYIVDSVSLGAMLEAGASYMLDEICNKINRTDNSGMAVNEMEQLSYAYIDCGADGEIELALRFDGLVNMYDGNGSNVYIIKNVNGRLEMCYSLEEMYRSWAELSNEYGMVAEGGYGGYGDMETIGYLDADSTYTQLYRKQTEDWGYDASYYFNEYNEPDLYNAVAGAEYLLVKTGYFFEPYKDGQDYDEYQSGIKNSFELCYRDESGNIPVEDVDPLVYEDSIYQEIFDAAGVPFYSAAEIDDMIADRAEQIGLTEKIMNGKPVEWIPFGEGDYNRLYGVEKEDGVSDLARAMEAYRRFLSDRGHFKEILAHSIGWPYENDIRFGMVDGFFIKDMNGDGIPELLIESADAWGWEQALFIYVFDTDSGRVKLDHIFDAMGSMIYEKTFPINPFSGTDWLLYDMEGNDLMLFGYNDANQLVWFHHGISANESITMYWCDYSVSDTDLTLHYYYEDCNMWERIPVYEMNEISDSRDEAERALQGYKPFLFYDVTQENIDKYVIEDYLGAGMEDYDKEDVIDDKEAFRELYYSVSVIATEDMSFGPNFVSDELGAVNYSYNLEYLFQWGYK